MSEELKIPEDLRSLYEMVLASERDGDVSAHLFPATAKALIERVGEVDSALDRACKNWAEDQIALTEARERISRLEARNKALVEALNLYEATAADEMKYSAGWKQCHDKARAAIAAGRGEG